VRAGTELLAPFDWHTRTYSGSLTGPQAVAIGHEWVLRTLGVNHAPAGPSAGVAERSR